jgi:threonine synthase
MYVCSACGRTYDLTTDAYRCACGGPFEFAKPPRPGGDEPPEFDRNRGLWAFEELLAVDRRVTLGEGWTPLVEAPGREATYKLEWLFPTGSFKDRGAATTMSHALELDVERVVEDSFGNAGAAIATYAARGGVDAEIFVPADAKRGTLRAIERTGATIRPIEGDRTDVTAACIDAVESGTPNAETSPWYASHAWNPAFLEGTGTFAYEIAVQRDWTAPDAVVTPLGHGTLFLGAFLGFKRLHTAGWIESLPRLYGVQAEGAAPIVADRHGDAVAAGNTELASGIQIRDPVRHGAIIEAIETTGGDAIAVDTETTEREYDRLHHNGLSVEPTSAVAPAALDILRADDRIDTGEDVIVALTGSGLKA